MRARGDRVVRSFPLHHRPTAARRGYSHRDRQRERRRDALDAHALDLLGRDDDSAPEPRHADESLLS